MTENEAKAIKWIKNVRDDAVITLDHIQKNEPNVSPMLYEGRKQKAEIILEMCEELEQYREIGNVEEIKSFFNDNRKAGYKHGYSDGYNNAIDEFERKSYKWNNTSSKKVPYAFVRWVAEQMKGGAE